MKIMKLIFLINLIFSTFYIQSAKIFGEIQLDWPEEIGITDIAIQIIKDDISDLKCHFISHGEKHDKFEFTNLKSGNYVFRLEAEIYDRFFLNKRTKVLLFSCKIELKDDDIKQDIIMNWKQIYEIICNHLSKHLEHLKFCNSSELTEDPEKNEKFIRELKSLENALSQLENLEILFNNKAYWDKEILPHMEISKKILAEYQQFSS